MTSTSTFLETMDRTIAERSMLKHPFYQEWNAGTLPLSALQTYAEQYFHFEAAFPTFLSALHSRCALGWARQAILENLWDEEHGVENHLALWVRFCKALGLTDAKVRESKPRAVTLRLIEGFRAACRYGSVSEGLATLYAYESQASEVSRQKLVGLRRFYGIEDPGSLSFFAVHQDLDGHHASREKEIILASAQSASEQADAERATRVAADLLWSFLDGAYRQINVPN